MYRPIIGLEIHIELKTKTKMFCGCLNDPFEKHPNINICPICLGHPGTLPTINKKAVESVLKLGLALNCQIPEISKFDRKNYFYPDLPKGYQISQYDKPLCISGYLEINSGTLDNQKIKKVRIRRIHLEEDTGRLLHMTDDNNDDKKQLSKVKSQMSIVSLVDFNRAGVPLMELVTEPDIENGEEAVAFAKELQLILRYLEISDADMEKGQMRVEVNVSIRPNNKRIKTNGKRIILADESYRLMNLLFEIHNKLGPIYKEKNYQDAIEEVLKREKIPYEREKNINLEFEKLKVSNFFADFVIDSKILIEVKASKFITQEDIRQVLRYIKSANLPLGIIVNFRKDKLEYKRLVNPLFDFNSLSFVENSGENLGTKVEIKNLNSFRAIEEAIQYEVSRQTEILESGAKVSQETRGWDDIKKQTVSQRIKEEAHDYRYFPEPDLPILLLRPSESEAEALQNGAPRSFTRSEKGGVAAFDLEKLKIEIPELPVQKRKRFIDEYNLSPSQIEILVDDRDLAQYFEESVSELGTDLRGQDADSRKKAIQLLYNYLTSDIKGLINEQKISIKELNITPENLADLIILILKDEISSRLAKDILREMFFTGLDPKQIIQQKGLVKISDNNLIEQVIEEMIKENPKAVEDYKKGKENALQFLIGQAMSRLKGRADPQKLKEIFKNKLK